MFSIQYTSVTQNEMEQFKLALLSLPEVESANEVKSPQSAPSKAAAPVPSATASNSEVSPQPKLSLAGAIHYSVGKQLPSSESARRI